MAEVPGPPALREAIGPPLGRLARRVLGVWWRIAKPSMLGVKGIVLDGDDVLLVRHTYTAGWHLPGGGVKRGESVDDAVRRELREECGVEVEAGDGTLRLLGLHVHRSGGKTDHIATFVVEGRWERPDGVPGPGLEIAEQGFFPIDELPRDTNPASRRRLEELRSGAVRGFRW